MLKYHTVKTYNSNGGNAPCILNFDTSWKCVFRYTLRPLYPGRKSTRRPFDRTSDGSQIRSGRDGE